MMRRVFNLCRLLFYSPALWLVSNTSETLHMAPELTPSWSRPADPQTICTGQTANEILIICPVNEKRLLESVEARSPVIDLINWCVVIQTLSLRQSSIKHTVLKSLVNIKLHYFYYYHYFLVIDQLFKRTERKKKHFNFLIF